MKRYGLALLACSALVAAGCGQQPGTERAGPRVQQFWSRPDLKPPVVTITTAAEGTSPGYIFLAPKRGAVQSGPMIIDDSGQLVWFRPLDTGGVTDFRAQQFQGKPVLTWWRGKSVNGVGSGYYVIADTSYREIARVQASEGLAGDVHEFLITPRETALITVYHKLPYDLSSLDGPQEGSILEGVVEEIDIVTGKLLFEWHSADEVAVDETYQQAPPASQGSKASPFDYFHINSIDEEPDGNLLISARNTHALYEIDRTSGKIRWRLGGKRSDYQLGPGVRFAWQHDARRHPDGTITLFDNEANPPVEQHSRALVLRLDDVAKTATLVAVYLHPDGLLSGSQGNVELLPDDHYFVGWGANPYFTEFATDGRVLFSGHFDPAGDSYRVYRFEWGGQPGDRPALFLRRSNDIVTGYVSWNGATEVTSWQALAGPTGDRLRPIRTVPKHGFETSISLSQAGPYIQVRALDAAGQILGSSIVQKVPAGQTDARRNR